MAGIPIYPFDNDRLKTAKVIAALRDSSQLPEKRVDWPNALECRQAFVEKVAKATGVAPIKPSADRPFASALNAALGISIGGGSGGNGGGGSYTAQAVHFDGDSTVVPFIFQESMPVADSTKLTIACWIKIPANYAPVHYSDSLGGGTAHFGDLAMFGENLDSTLIDMTTNASHDLAIRMQNPAPDYHYTQFFSDGGVVPENAWVFILNSIDTSTGQTTGSLVINTTNVRNPTLDDNDGVGPYAMALNGLAFFFPYDFAGYGNNINLPFDCADIQMWTDVAIDPTPENLAHFIDGNGKPVDPAQAAAAFGQQAYLFSGSSFASNHGSGGAVSLYAGCSNSAVAVAGPGSIDMPGAQVGAAVQKVWALGAATAYLIVDVTAQFESTISVAGSIQQTSSTDYTGSSIRVAFAGSLTNATTSPST